MTKKIFFVLPLLFLFISHVNAQSKQGSTHGVVVEEGTGNPIPYINVLLLKLPDSVLVTGGTTDKKGRYEIKDIEDGDYLLKFSSIGFKEFISSGYKIAPGKRKITADTVALTSSVMETEQIVVSGKKEIYNNSIDKKVYNVKQDIMSKSGTAGDLLQNIPSISVDIDGNVSLRGNQNVMIMINGKTSPLMDKASATVLDELPANSIDRIEVITNPSASYKPDGTSGIINIVLKKDADRGWNSNITMNVGNDSRYNTNVNFNYNPGKFNLFGSYSFRHDKRQRLNSVDREETDTAGVKTYYKENGAGGGWPIVHLIKLGSEYNLDKFNKFSIEGDYLYQDATRTTVTSSTYFDAVHTITEDYDRHRRSPELAKEYSATFGYQHNFGEEDHDLEFELKTSRAPESEQNYYVNMYRFPINTLDEKDNDDIQQNDKVTEVTVKYKRPLGDKASLESGYSGEYCEYSNDLYVDYYDYTLGKFVKDLGKSSIFKLNKSINALYSTYSNEVGAFGFMAGVRLEKAELKPNLVTNNTTFNNNYFNLFPTLHLKYTLDDVSSLQLNYSKRVRRPQDDDLSPFPEYQDPRNVRAGNPHLLPEYINSIEFGYQMQYKSLSFIPSIYYRHTTNRFTQVTQRINDSTLMTTQQNLKTDQSGGVELVASASVQNIFSLQASLNGFYNQIDASNLGYVIKSSAYSWSGTFSINFNVTKTTMFQINSVYRSLRLTPQGETSPAYAVNAGLKQDLLNERISVVLTVSDIFNTMKFKNNLSTALINDTSVRQRDGRIVYLGVTYHFGRTDKKKKDKLEYENGTD